MRKPLCAQRKTRPNCRALQQNLYEGVEDTIAGEVAEGYLAFLTKKAVSTKEINTSELPSGFREEADGDGIFSMLGGDMSSVFNELQEMLPEDASAGSVLEGISDTVLFHAYLMTHFTNYLEGNEIGRIPLVAQESVAKATYQDYLKKILNLLT